MLAIVLCTTATCLSCPRCTSLQLKHTLQVIFSQTPPPHLPHISLILDGRLWYIPNAILSSVRIANYHRSKPLCGLITIELPYTSSAGQMQALTTAIREYCLSDESSFDTPSIFVNDPIELNKIKLNVWCVVAFSLALSSHLTIK